MSNPPWACLRKKDLGWDRGVESKKVVQHVYLVGAKSIYRVAEKDKEYLRDEEEKNQNTACGASCWRRGSLHPNASQVFGYIFVLILNNGFNGEGALYICCGLAIFFNYLNIDWIYQGLEEYGYITGRSVVIKCISLALLVVFVKTREDYVAYALLTSLALGGNYIFNVIHARKMVGFTLVNLKIRKHIKPIVFIAGIIFMSTIYNKIDAHFL